MESGTAGIAASFGVTLGTMKTAGFVQRSLGIPNSHALPQLLGTGDDDPAL